jgi:hypothetical protein
MQIQQLRPTQVQLTLHSFELATLMAAARWVSDGCAGELPPAAIDQIRQVVHCYDMAWQQKQTKVPQEAADEGRA